MTRDIHIALWRLGELIAARRAKDSDLLKRSLSGVMQNPGGQASSPFEGDSFSQISIGWGR